MNITFMTSTPPPVAPIPVPYPTIGALLMTDGRDAASGLPTGKRMHKPYNG